MEFWLLSRQKEVFLSKEEIKEQAIKYRDITMNGTKDYQAKMILNEEALNIIREINEPIAVVAVGKLSRYQDVMRFTYSYCNLKHSRDFDSWEWATNIAVIGVYFIQTKLKRKGFPLVIDEQIWKAINVS